MNINLLPIHVYTQPQQGWRWLEHYQGKRPIVACILGFTETGLIPGISAAGATPIDREFTAIADAEFLVNGVHPSPVYPLPPLHVGASPVFISRAVVEGLQLPLLVFNAGLPHPPAIPAIELQGVPAHCLSTGRAMALAVVEQLFQQGLHWGEKLAAQAIDSYVVLGECVVGGTTTALAVLTGLGIDAIGKINSSHAVCNHEQKWKLVEKGLRMGAGEQGEDRERGEKKIVVSDCSQGSSLLSASSGSLASAFHLMAAIGDPMQIVVAGMAIAASRTCGVLLAGGTQMLAVYALLRAIAEAEALPWNTENIVVGTTRWVAEDPTGDTIGLAKKIGGVPLVATTLRFTNSRFAQLQAYEKGFVKEGVGAGGCAIAASLYQRWTERTLLSHIEAIVERYQNLGN
jgi:uncharacterized protein (TIGR00303 family)